MKCDAIVAITIRGILNDEAAAELEFCAKALKEKYSAQTTLFVGSMGTITAFQEKPESFLNDLDKHSKQLQTLATSG